MFFKKKKIKTCYELHETCQIKELSELYKDYFGYKKDGVFVEFGAYDGESFSNTSGLADLGWKGIYIEPIKEYYKKCKRRHRKNKNVTVLNLAISSKSEDLNFYKGGPLSTSHKKSYWNFRQNISWASNYFKSGEIEKVSAIPLDSLLRDQNISSGFDLLVVDAQGADWDALKSFDLSYWKPKMVIIELHDMNKNYQSMHSECEKLIEYFNSYSYNIVHKDLTHTIYVHSSLFKNDKSYLDSSVFSRHCFGKWLGTSYEFAERNEAAVITRIETLARLNQTLKKHNIKMFLMYGTLLGAVRDKKLITHDRDEDVGILIQDKEKFTNLVILELEMQGFELVRAYNHGKEIDSETKDDFCHAITVGRNGYSIDIVIFKPYDEESYMYHRTTSLIKKSFLDSLDTVSMYNEEYYIPNNSDQVLLAMYGDTWQIPQSNKFCTSHVIS